MILTNLHGFFLPCMILGHSTKIPNGYYVYVFYFNEEIDIFPNSVIGNLKALMHCEVSFRETDGQICTGHVRGTDWKTNNDSKEPLNFFISRTDSKECVWVSFPYLFLNHEQSKLFCC